MDFKKFHLGADRYVSGSVFQGREYVHIRCYVKNNQEHYPSPKGIAFPLMRFRVLCDSRNLINPTEDDVFHIGGNVYVTINTQYRTVDIRQFFMLDGKLQATKNRNHIENGRMEHTKKLYGESRRIHPFTIPGNTLLPREQP